MTQRPYKRKIKLIKRELQLRLIAYVFLITLALLSFHSLVLVLLITKAEFLMEAGGRNFMFWVPLADVAVTVSVVLIVEVVLGIHVTHKFAGPLYKFEQTLGRMAQGDISDRLRLRKGDMLVDFCEKMNVALEGLRTIANEDRKKLEEVGLALVELEAKLTHDPETAKAVESLEQALLAVRSRFVTEREEPAGPSAAPAASPGTPVPAAP